MNHYLTLWASAIVLFVTFLPNHALAANYHALLIAINDYNDDIGDLQGAVNDANILSTSLQKYAGFRKSNITKLTNRKASKAAIRKSWKRMIRKAKAGDTVLFSFSGHGFKERDVNGDEKVRNPDDQHDEVLLLSRFSTKSSSRMKERIVDDELAKWFKEAEKRKLRVIYLADTCYSGDSFRNTELGKVRALQPDEEQQQKIEKALAKNPQPQSKLQLADIKNLYTFSSANSEQLAQERKVNGKSYGMLSWFTAQALKVADSNQNNKLSHAELSEYLNTNIRITSNRFMTPETTPDEQTTETLFELKTSKTAEKPSNWPADTLLSLQEKSPLQSYFYEEKEGKHIPMDTTKVGDKVHFATEPLKHSHLFQFAATVNTDVLDIQCLPSQKQLSLEQRLDYQQQFQATLPAGKQLLITLAVEEPSDSLKTLLEPDCSLTSKEINSKLPDLLANTDYQLGVSELFIWK